MRPPALAVALAAMCVLAGCNAFAPGGDGSPPTDDAGHTVTPADVPRDVADGTLAPGLSEAGLVDRTALFRAHRSHLADRSVRIDRRTVLLHEGRAASNLSQRTVVGPDRTRMILDTNVTGSVTTVVGDYGYFTNGSTDIERRAIDGTVRYTATPSSAPSAEGRLRQRLESLRDVLYRIDVRSVERVGEREGYALYRVTADDPQRQEYPDEGGETDVLADVRMTVDERGVVHSLRTVEDSRRPARSVAGTDDRDPTEAVTVTVVERVTFAADAAVDRPGWVAEGFERVAEREYLVPGVTDAGVVRVEQLWDAHARVVANASARFERTVARSENGTVVDEHRVSGAVDRTTERRRLVERYVDRNETYDTWANATVGYRRVAHADGADYDRLSDVTLTRSFEPRLPRNLAFANTTVTRLDDGRYRVVATDVPSPTYVSERYERVTVVVDDRGFVSSAETRAVRIGVGRVLRTFTAETGPTTVDRPDWLDAARNATVGGS